MINRIGTIIEKIDRQCRAAQVASYYSDNTMHKQISISDDVVYSDSSKSTANHGEIKNKPMHAIFKCRQANHPFFIILTPLGPVTYWKEEIELL